MNDHEADSLDDEDVLSEEGRINLYREHAQDLFKNFFKPSLCLLKSHIGQSLALDCYLLAIGEFDILGVSTQVEVADIYGCERENVRKLVKKFQMQLGIPIMPGQRGEEGKEKMRTTRKAQLK